MTQTVAVFGLGYVGCVSAACFAKDRQVIGVDVNQAKVDMINQGISPVLEPGLADLVKEVVGAGRLRATTDTAEAVRGAGISLVCVGTPSKPNGSLDLSFVVREADADPAVRLLHRGLGLDREAKPATIGSASAQPN